jgi:saccharopine dehydrogenase-like NADP-dependent oxidoreductase
VEPAWRAERGAQLGALLALGPHRRGARREARRAATALTRARSQIPGEKLLSSASPIDIYPAFNFEQLPNRDSLKYRDVYGLHNATTIYRGTLRYRGFCGALDAFRRWGLLSADAARRPTVGAWSDYLCTLLRCTPATLRQSMLAALGEASQSTGAKGMETAEWLGMLNGSAQVEPADSPIDAFCKLLQTRLQFGPKERDMVVLHHTFHVLPDGSATASGARRIQSTLLAYGDEQWSAMARTVGIPAALVTRAIAEGRWQKPGVHIPSDPALVELLMRELRAEGISFVERVM